MEHRLAGKTALVTGGSRGIGKAIATILAQHGTQVMITSRKADACQDAAAEVGHGCLWEAGHVADPDDTERVITTAMERMGGVDILVNNAATSPYPGPVIDVDGPRWQKTFDVNLTAPLQWTQQVWQRHQREHGGTVVNIASVGALQTNANIGVYDISKAALVHLTKQLAVELAPTTRVNAICPALIRTDFARMLWEGGRGERVAANYPMQRLGEPEDVAEAALYLASDASSWVTGQVIVVDGGSMVAFPRA